VVNAMQEELLRRQFPQARPGPPSRETATAFGADEFSFRKPPYHSDAQLDFEDQVFEEGKTIRYPRRLLRADPPLELLRVQLEGQRFVYVQKDETTVGQWLKFLDSKSEQSVKCLSDVKEAAGGVAASARWKAYRESWKP